MNLLSEMTATSNNVIKKTMDKKARKSRWSWWLSVVFAIGMGVLLMILLAIVLTPITPELHRFRGWLTEHSVWLFIPRLGVYLISFWIAVKTIFGLFWYQNVRQCRQIIAMGILLMAIIEIGLVQGKFKTLFLSVFYL